MTCSETWQKCGYIYLCTTSTRVLCKRISTCVSEGFKVVKLVRVQGSKSFLIDSYMGMIAMITFGSI